MAARMVEQAPDNHRPTWAQISLSALEQNYLTIKSHLGSGSQLMAVVKADAYGHGALRCARALESINADWFGVALIEEGIALRQANITRPILCLGGFWRGQGDDALAHDLTPVIFRLDAAEELNARAKEAGRTAKFHLKVDTGMGRLGVSLAELAAFAQALKRFNQLALDGLMTHFADADGNETEYTALQIERFNQAKAILRELGFSPTWRHLANSAGLHAYPRAQENLARAGATLYGLTRDVLAHHAEPFTLQPVMSLHSTIIHLKTVPAGVSLGYGRSFTTARESRIATLAIGYADGYRRALSNVGRVIVRGSLAPIVGRVSMDLTIIDVTEIPNVMLGDEVVLLGRQTGLRIDAEDLAKQTGTISYEIVTGVSSRVPRVYV